MEESALDHRTYDYVATCVCSILKVMWMRRWLIYMSRLYGWQDQAQHLSLLLNRPEAVGSVHQQPVLRPAERLLDGEEGDKE